MSTSTTPLTSQELSAAALLAATVALRLFGLFLIFPVFAIYARELAGATPLLIGIGLGAYGLTQGALQIPAGWLSDRVGRKRIIAAGLVIFVAGSVVAALSTEIQGVIIGRALQGCGAISGAAMALAADLSRPEQRSKVMAMIGASVGTAFALAMIFGSVLAGLGGLAGLFWISAAAGTLALGLLLWLVPENRSSGAQRLPLESRQRTAYVIDWCFGVFLLHALLTALFVVLPASLARAIDVQVADHWLLYVPALAIAGLISVGVVFAGRERQAPRRLAPAAFLIALACAAFAFASMSFLFALVALALFFTGFSLMEATLPALMSHSAGTDRRGAALGAYASCQFLGAFAGGLLAGALYASAGGDMVFIVAAAVAAIWCLYAVFRTNAWAQMRTL